MHRLAAGDPSGATPKIIAASAVDALRAHDWPGNVRELRNVLERAAYLARATGQKEIASVGLPGAGPSSRESTTPTFEAGKSYRDTRAEWEAGFEKAYVSWLLDKHGGNISAAARAADMDRKYLHKLARRHGVHPSSDDGESD